MRRRLLSGPSYPDGDVGDDQYTEENVKLLRKCNLAAGILHGISFAAALTLVLVFSSQSVFTELRTDYRVYGANATVSTGGTQPDAAGPFEVLCASLGFYRLSWIIIAFPAITSIFHLVIASVDSVNLSYSVAALREGRNPIRWYEYAITASLMVWVIAQLSGVTNVYMLTILVLMNVALQFQGYIMETVNVGRKRNVDNGFFWSPTVIGFILFAAQWLPIFAYFFAAITSERPPDADSVPWFVYSIVFGLFFQFLLFGLLMTAHYAGYPKWFSSHYNNEIAYVTLSFTSKLFLDWNLLIGIITNPMA